MNTTNAARVSGSVFDIKRFALHDGPGTRVTVHLKGCPLSCLWCHNPEGQSQTPRLLFRKDLCVACGVCLKACPQSAAKLSKSRVEKAACISCGACVAPCPAGAREICGKTMNAADVVRTVLLDESFFDSADSSERGGVTLSGGEPLAQSEFCMALLKLFGRHGVHRAIDTSGCVPEEVILEAAKHCELFLYDIKHMDTLKHREYTGEGNELILSNLKKLSDLKTHSETGSIDVLPRIQLRVPFIPGVNSDVKNIGAVAELASALGGISGVNILPYHKAAAGKHKRWGFSYTLGETREPSEAELLAAVRIFEEKHIAVTIGG